MVVHCDGQRGISAFKMPFIAADKDTRECPETTVLEVKDEQKEQWRIQALRFGSTCIQNTHIHTRARIRALAHTPTLLQSQFGDILRARPFSCNA